MGGTRWEAIPGRSEISRLRVEVDRLREELEDANRWRDKLAAKVIEVESECDRLQWRISALTAAECTVHADVRRALGAVVHEADLMLAGGELAIQHAEQCSECGCGGVGPLRDALHAAHRLLGPTQSNGEGER